MGEPSDNVIQIDRVQCLECSMRYIKPADGGTVQENPGCPKCGYVGWISATIPAAARGGLRRFAGNRRPNQAVRAH